MATIATTRLASEPIKPEIGSLHRATEYPEDSIRMLHRTKLEGEEPIV